MINSPLIPGDPYAYDLKWIVSKIKELLETTETLGDDITDLRNYIDNYFEHLDIPAEVQDIIAQMVADGDFDIIINNYISTHGVVLADTDQSSIFTNAEKTQARKNIGAANVTPNMIINPHFLINQRAFSTVTNPASTTYVADMWFMAAFSGTVTNTGKTIRVANGANSIALQTHIPEKNLTDKPLTVSCQLADGSIFEKTVTSMPARTTSAQTVIDYNTGAGITIRYIYSANGQSYDTLQLITDANSTIEFMAAKAEINNFSTLEYEVEEPYNTALNKCQYYFERISSGTSGYMQIGLASSGGGGYSVYLYMHIAPKNKAATVSYSGTIKITTDAFPNGITINGLTSGVSGTPAIRGHYRLDISSPSSLPASTIYRVGLDAGAYIDFSAEN